MKLVFPNGDRDQVELTQGRQSIGSDAECDIVLSGDGVAPHHARIEQGPDGLIIEVDDATNITRVNGTLVVVRTRVSPGDALLFGTVPCQITGTASATPQRPVPPPIQAHARNEDEDSGATKVRMAIPKFILRGVSGSTFGKNYPLYKDTTIGRHSDCDICLAGDEVSRKHARMIVSASGLEVEDLGSSNGTFINGKQVQRAKLNPGDEVRLDTVRFLVQIPGMDTPAKSASPPAAESTPQKATAEAQTTRKSSLPIIISVVVVLAIGAVAAMKYFGVF